VSRRFQQTETLSPSLASFLPGSKHQPSKELNLSDLTTLAAEIRTCQRCRLAQTRLNAVPGEGPEHAPVMLIGEGPGFYEDRQGRPFVGRSGELLEKLLGSIGLRRRDVFIANVVKCRPPDNRDPLPDEIEACRPYLERQIELIRPKLVITLGRISMGRYFPGQSITRIHGQLKRVGEISYVPMFHPAAALRNPQWMAAIRADFIQLAPLVADLYPGRTGELPTSAPDEEQQLSLF
jgi:DNA polymerase